MRAKIFPGILNNVSRVNLARIFRSGGAIDFAVGAKSPMAVAHVAFGLNTDAQPRPPKLAMESIVPKGIILSIARPESTGNLFSFFFTS